MITEIMHFLAVELSTASTSSQHAALQKLDTEGLNCKKHNRSQQSYVETPKIWYIAFSLRLDFRPANELLDHWAWDQEWRGLIGYTT